MFGPVHEKYLKVEVGGERVYAESLPFSDVAANSFENGLSAVDSVPKLRYCRRENYQEREGCEWTERQCLSLLLWWL